MQKNSLLQCICGDGNWCDGTGAKRIGPVNEEIVTHGGDDENEPGHIHIVEYSEPCSCGCGKLTCYDSKFFREIQPPMDIDISEIVTQKLPNDNTVR